MNRREFVKGLALIGAALPVIRLIVSNDKRDIIDNSNLFADDFTISYSNKILYRNGDGAADYTITDLYNYVQSIV